MKYVGAHVGASGGVYNAPLNAMKIGAKAVALFTKNQRHGWPNHWMMKQSHFSRKTLRSRVSCQSMSSLTIAI